MPTIATNDGLYSGLPNKLVGAANGLDYADVEAFLQD
jgi:hypothetical protein